MNEKLSQFIKETKVQIAQSEKFKIYDAETLPQMTKNFSLHELNQLKILILTWNLAGSTPTEKDFVEIFGKEEKLFLNDLIIFGTQECSQSIFVSFFYNSKSGWEDLLFKKFKGNYLVLKSIEMNAMHLIIFAKRHLVNLISEIDTSQIATGFLNFIGNKGAIGISFKLSGVSFLFFSCHFAAGDTEIESRNATYDYIEQNSNLGFEQIEKKVSNRFDRVFWFGDFNYRVELTAENLKDAIKDRNYMALLKFDQLQKEILKGTVFQGFEEGPITFNPTYKHSANSCEYTYSLDDKKNPRVPSWTDRILFKSLEKKAIRQSDYGSMASPFCSDHRAVFSHFVVSLNKRSYK